MKVGNYFAIIGAVLGILSIFLFYVLPDVFYLWGIDVTGMTDLRLYLGGFQSGAYSYGGPLKIRFSMEGSMWLVSILMAVGPFIMLIGGLEGKRDSGIGGGVTTLIGGLILVLVLLTGMGIFGDLASTLSLMGQNLLYGSLSQMGMTINWGLGLGFYLALTVGALGIIGGAFMERG